jgi:arginine exporter protein ArgO
MVLKLLMIQLSHCESSFPCPMCLNARALISDALRAFLDPTAIITCTLLGVISRHMLSTEGKLYVISALSFGIRFWFGCGTIVTRVTRLRERDRVVFRLTPDYLIDWLILYAYASICPSLE